MFKYRLPKSSSRAYDARLTNGMGEIPMKSIIQEAIAKHQENQALVEEKKPTAPGYASADDAELSKLAETASRTRSTDASRKASRAPRCAPSTRTRSTCSRSTLPARS